MINLSLHDQHVMVKLKNNEKYKTFCNVKCEIKLISTQLESSPIKFNLNQVDTH